MWLLRCGYLVAFALLLVACGGGGSGSGGDDGSAVPDGSTRGFLLRWHAAPEAAGYVVHWGTESGVYEDALDVGSPVPDADGVASFVLERSGASSLLFFALTSYDDAYRMSAFSNEIAVAVR